MQLERQRALEEEYRREMEAKKIAAEQAREAEIQAQAQ